MMRSAVAVLVAACFVPTGVRAQKAVFYPHNQIAPSYFATLTQDSATGDFRYAYTVSNAASATQRIATLFVVTPVPLAAMEAPPDWDFQFDSVSTLSAWNASGTIDPSWAPAGSGDVPSFLSEIAPGKSLGGFVLLSPCAATTTDTVYAQGYNHLSTMDSVGNPPVGAPGTWKEDAVVSTVLGPGDCSVVQDWGNRRPGVDGFMGVVNFSNGAALPGGPVPVQIRFSRSGEQVDRATFHAELNRVDVTAVFRTNTLGDLAALFTVGGSPLAHGKNVLLISVDGIVPGTTHTATDTDRFTFTVP